MNTKHLFFDLDGTITESRQVISPKMKEKLLSFKEPFVVATGAEKARLIKQMDGVPCIMLAQNGNDAPDWKNTLTENEKFQVWQHLEKVSKFTGVPIDKETVHDRGCQISLSFTGHNADVKWKKKFDPEKKYREDVLKNVPFKSKTMLVRVAGTTCFDYNKKGNLKGDNLKRYMRLHRLKKNDCIFYGDNFDKGGNDESVLKVMPCVKVSGPTDLWKKL